jgi:hypothetical protein
MEPLKQTTTKRSKPKQNRKKKQKAAPKDEKF